MTANADLAPVRVILSREEGEGCGLAPTVAPHEGVQLSSGYLEVEPLEHIRPVAVIAEPHLPGLQGKVPGSGLVRGLYGGLGLVPVLLQPGPPLLHCHGAGLSPLHSVVNLHGHRAAHPQGVVGQSLPHLPGGAVTEDFALLQHHHPVRHGEHLVQTVLHHHHRQPQLLIEPLEGMEKVGGRHGVQLGGGLVQHQHLGVHGHHRGQVEKLLFPAGQLLHLPVKPALEAKIAGHLRHPKPHVPQLQPQVLQAEGHLVPYLIGDQLLLGILHHKANLPRLGAQVHLVQRSTLVEDLSGPGSVRGQGTFELADEGGFSTPGPPADHHEFPWPNLEVYLSQRRDRRIGIGEGQILHIQ